jgi:hypothetical protein
LFNKKIFFNKVLYQKCTLKWDVFKMILFNKVLFQKCTLAPRLPGSPKEGMERHYAEDQWDDYCTVMCANKEQGFPHMFDSSIQFAGG